MRILLLVTDAYGGHGGIAAYNRGLCEALAAMPEVEEIVVLPRVMRFEPEDMPAKVRFVRSAAGGKASYLRNLASLMTSRFDLLICGHVNLLSVATPFAVFKGVPMVLQVYGIDVWERPAFWKQLAIRSVDRVWSISAVTRQRMNSWAGLADDKFKIIPVAIRLESYGMEPKRNDLVSRHGLHGRKVLMTLARLDGRERYKGIDEVIEVLPELVKREPTLAYVVMGDGDDRARLEAKAALLGLSSVVKFAGFVEEDEKADHLRLADAFVLPGRGEGFGIVYLEALACGIPVVGSRLDGSSEALLHGELGELADPDDLATVRDCILRALDKKHAVPAGLGHYAWPRFQERVAGAVHEMMPAEARPTRVA